ncbi:hypothetical protein SNEBB_003889, partial [Seison nebaliae]
MFEENNYFPFLQEKVNSSVTVAPSEQKLYQNVGPQISVRPFVLTFSFIKSPQLIIIVSKTQISSVMT